MLHERFGEISSELEPVYTPPGSVWVTPVPVAREKDAVVALVTWPSEPAERLLDDPEVNVLLIW
jgi:hypothetical protein